MLLLLVAARLQLRALFPRTLYRAAARGTEFFCALRCCQLRCYYPRRYYSTWIHDTRATLATASATRTAVKPTTATMTATTRVAATAAEATPTTPATEAARTATTATTKATTRSTSTASTTTTTTAAAAAAATLTGASVLRSREKNGCNRSRLKAMHQAIVAGKMSDPNYARKCADELSSLLTAGALTSKELTAIAELVNVVNCTSPEGILSCIDLLRSLSTVLLGTQDEAVLDAILPGLLRSCAAFTYYDAPLMTHAGAYITREIGRFNVSELKMIVYSFAKMNHYVPRLIPLVEKIIMQRLMRPKFKFYHRVLWNLAYAGMVFSEHPTHLLQYILNDDYINDCDVDISHFMFMLFQLKISLNAECPDLNFGLGADTAANSQQWGVCRSGLRGISDGTFLRTYLEKLRQYSIYQRSKFDTDIQRAIESALGTNVYSQCDALSLSGYIFDFELLMDEQNEPIPIPSQWKGQSAPDLAVSIGECTSTKLWRTSALSRARVRDECIFRRIGDSSSSSSSSSASALRRAGSHLHSGRHMGLTNLASDWGGKFAEVSTPVARKLVIEANGPTHYAHESDHPLGNTVLKTKHLQYLGWEVLNVDSRKWYSKSRKEKLNYIASKIFNYTLPQSQSP